MQESARSSQSFIYSSTQEHVIGLYFTPLVRIILVESANTTYVDTVDATKNTFGVRELFVYFTVEEMKRASSLELHLAQYDD